jgi:hypothetical protein
MKEFKLIVVGIMLLFGSAMKAQVSVNVNIGTPPLWGPAGYTEVHYYYLPDVQAYYDIDASMFIILSDGVWVHRSHLPSQYRNYDLYGGYKVVITDYHGTAPYKNFDDDKAKYSKGYHGPQQKNIGEKPGKGNSGGKDDHHDDNGKDDNGHDKGGSSGHDNGNGKHK